MLDCYATDKALSPPPSSCPEGAAVLIVTLSDKYVFITFHTPEFYR